jgi:hypothetical protein
MKPASSPNGHREKSRSGAIVYGAVYMNIPQIDEARLTAGAAGTA